MTSRERVVAALNQQPTDRVPIHHLGFSSDVASALLGREAFVGGGIQMWRESDAWWRGEDAHTEFVARSFQDALDIAQVCEHDIIRCGYWRYQSRPTKRIDENTFLYEHGSEEQWKVMRYDPGSEQAHVFDYVPKPEAELEDLEREIADYEAGLADFAPSEASISNELAARDVLGEDYVYRMGGVAAGFPGTTVWMEAVALRPDLIARYLDVQVEWNRRTVPFMTERGFRVFFTGNDFAGNDGPMYSPQAFHELMLPRLIQTADIVHDCGGYVLFASDGDLWPVADDLFGTSGFDGYYEIDRRAGMDLGKLRQRFPDLTLIGNISSHTVARGTREQVVAETVSCLEAAKQHHGIIVGASNYFVPGTPIQNVEAVLETIEQYR